MQDAHPCRRLGPPASCHAAHTVTRLRRSSVALQGPRPTANKTFLVAAPSVHAAIAAWSFLYSYSESLELTQFPLEAFQNALLDQGRELPLLLKEGGPAVVRQLLPAAPLVPYPSLRRPCAVATLDGVVPASHRRSLPAVFHLLTILGRAVLLSLVDACRVGVKDEDGDIIIPDGATMETLEARVVELLTAAVDKGVIPASRFSAILSPRFGGLAQLKPADRLDLITALTDVTADQDEIRACIDNSFEELKSLRVARRELVATYNRRKKEERKEDREAGVESEAESGEESEEESEEEPMSALANGPDVSPSKLTGRAGRRVLVEWQKRIKQEEEARKRRQLEKQKAGQRAAAQEQREQRELQQRRDALDEEHFRQVRDIDQRMFYESLHRKEPLGLDRQKHLYFLFPGEESRLYTASPDSKHWGYFETEEQLEQLYGSLNEKVGGGALFP